MAIRLGGTPESTSVPQSTADSAGEVDPLDAYIDSLNVTPSANNSGPSLADSLALRRRRNRGHGLHVAKVLAEDLCGDTESKDEGVPVDHTLVAADGVVQRVLSKSGAVQMLPGQAGGLLESSPAQAVPLMRLLHSKPAVFLGTCPCVVAVCCRWGQTHTCVPGSLVCSERYGRYLSATELQYFDAPRFSTYEVRLQLQQLWQGLQLGTEAVSGIVKNRRFTKAMQMVRSGTYFSDQQMKERNPRLFEQFIGRHVPSLRGVVKFSDVLMRSATHPRSMPAAPDSELESEEDDENLGARTDRVPDIEMGGDSLLEVPHSRAAGAGWGADESGRRKGPLNPATERLEGSARVSVAPGPRTGAGSGAGAGSGVGASVGAGGGATTLGAGGIESPMMSPEEVQANRDKLVRIMVVRVCERVCASVYACVRGCACGHVCGKDEA